MLSEISTFFSGLGTYLGNVRLLDRNTQFSLHEARLSEVHVYLKGTNENKKSGEYSYQLIGRRWALAFLSGILAYECGLGWTISWRRGRRICSVVKVVIPWTCFDGSILLFF